MKKAILTCLISFCFMGLHAQNNNPYKAYSDSLSQLKKEGKLTGEEYFFNPNATKELQVTKPNNHSSKKGKPNQTMSSTSCNCWIPRDASFHYVPFDGSGGSGGPGVAPTYANDDWSTAGITLPFNFCFYGTSAGTASNQLFINNNGNISFGLPYSVFTAVPFPSTTYTMVAPFWADVQTNQTGSGFVYYSLTPTHLVVQWDSVYYYGEVASGHNTLINTFQLIITNGTDPILPPGNNLSFCYGEMQWTTGYASGGTGGFGGTPATVGLNKGDSVTYFPIGYFDNAGSTYTSPTATNSGVGWLQGQSFYLNACGTGGNLPPVITSGGGSACAGDTLSICAVGDTLLHTVTFSPGAVGLTVSVTATSPGIGAGFSITGSTSGATASLTFMVNSASLTTGYYNVSVTATNSASLTTTINYVIHIIGSAIPPPSIVVTPTLNCGSPPSTITLSNSSSYDSWVWSTGATTASTTVATTSTVQVTVTKGGCQKTGSVIVPIYTSPNPVIGGVLNYCPPSTSTQIFVNQPVSGGTSPYSYNWTGGLSIGSTTTATLVATTGTLSSSSYTVVVTDAHGCTGTTSVTVTSGSVTALNITSAGSLCAGQDTLFSSITTATSYTWSPGVGSSTSTYVIGGTSGTYSLALLINNCPVTQTISISPPVSPTITITGNMSFCIGQTTTLTALATPTASSGYTYNWYNGSTNISATNTVSINTAGTMYAVTAVNNNTQCKNAQTFTIVISPNPTVVVSGNPTYCKGHGDSLTANPSGGTAPYTYSWMPGAVTTQTINAVPSASVINVNYSVTVTDSKGCQVTNYENIKQSNPHLLIVNPTLCPGYSTILTANGTGQAPKTYTWTSASTGHQVIGKKDTVYAGQKYWVTMADAYGCTYTDTVIVGQYPKPNANFTYSPNPPEQNIATSFTDNSTIASPDSVKWDSWYFGDLDTVVSNMNPAHTYTNGGSYMVTLIVASNHGCLDTITKMLTIQYAIIAPNIITPNGDGINEFLAFKNLQYFPNSKIWIYNRWGTQLYQNNDYKNDWTGKDYSDGTYFYILEVPGKQAMKGFFESIK